MIDDLLARFRHGDRLALARLLSLAAQGESLPDLPAPAQPARVVAVTGSPGVGKSTLVGKLIETARRKNVRVAVLACDPQSPVSGGALLGDRFRMSSAPDDDGVFIRSLAALSGHGAVADHVDLMLRLLETFGFEWIVIETVGAGQGDTAVHGLADSVLLLVQPETGDDLQWEKAGILEVADIVAVHKADLPGADRAAAQVRASLDLSSQSKVPVLRVSSRTGEGLETLWQALVDLPRRRSISADSGADLLKEAQALLTRRFAHVLDSAPFQALLEKNRAGSLPRAKAAAALLEMLASYESGSVTQG